MSSIPYQSTYALAPKYGTRYGPSQFAAATAPVASPETLGAQVPAVATVGAGIPGTVAGQQQVSGAVGQVAQVAAQPLTYSQDPFAYSGTVNGQTQTGTGFRPAGDYTYAPPTDTPYVPPTSPPPVTAGPNTQASNLIGSGGLSDEGPGYDYAGSRTAQAQALGYERGTQNPLGMLPYVGSFLTGSGDYTYGQEGTYDAQGNVFGPAGRAYDPITGQAVASYGTKTDAYNTITGSYGNLRNAGVNPVASALGSYDNSIYSRMDLNPNLNIQGARAERNRGVGAPIETIAGLIEANTDLALGVTQPGENSFVGITPGMIGFTGQRIGEPMTTTGKFGSGVGDVIALDGGVFGIKNADGTISTPTGTVVQISDSATGETISLLNKNADNQLRANQELDARAGNQNMSGFMADDGDGGTYQTDSSGTSGAYTGGYTGMEDEYDEPPAPDTPRPPTPPTPPSPPTQPVGEIDFWGGDTGGGGGEEASGSNDDSGGYGGDTGGGGYGDGDADMWAYGGKIQTLGQPKRMQDRPSVGGK